MKTLDIPLVGHWDSGAELAECPHWISTTHQLMFVDVLGPSITLLNLADGSRSRIDVTAKIGSATPTTDGRILAAQADGLWLLDGETRTSLNSPDLAGTHFNDGKCDALGRFWVGIRASDGGNGGGALWRVDHDGRVEVAASGFAVPNGLGWSPDGRFMYLIDTVPRHLWRYAFDEANGHISDGRIICRFEGLAGKPDGLAVANDGSIWIAMWDGNGITVLSPEGEAVSWLDTGCPRPTSCTFGDVGGNVLYVTTARYGLNSHCFEFGYSGSVLQFDVGATGCSAVPSTPFAILR